METRVESLIIRQARAGSDEALNEVFERFGEPLLALIRLRLGPGLRSQLESRDVLQQTMLRAFERIEQFEGSGEQSLMGWLGAIARNELLDQVKYHRRAGRDMARNVPLENAGSAVAQQVQSEVSRIHLKNQSRLLEQALDELSEEHREVILLHRFEELAFGQIAEHLGRTPGACRMLHTRAMAALTLKMMELEGLRDK